MDEGEIKAIYDEVYAADYEAKYIHSDVASSIIERELGIIGRLLEKKQSWLDVACGTGFFLSRFPEIHRTGIDISPAMLAIARRNNPGVEFREMNFLDIEPQWISRWDLVTSTWYAYGLVDRFADIEKFAANLAAYTAPTGTCFVPLVDPSRLVQPPLNLPQSGDTIHPGKIVMDAVIWSYYESSSKRHRHMIAPLVERMVEMFSCHFSQIDLIDYAGARRALIASGKKLTPRNDAG